MGVPRLLPAVVVKFPPAELCTVASMLVPATALRAPALPAILFTVAVESIAASLGKKSAAVDTAPHDNVV